MAGDDGAPDAPASEGLPAAMQDETPAIMGPDDAAAPVTEAGTCGGWWLLAGPLVPPANFTSLGLLVLGSPIKLESFPQQS